MNASRHHPVHLLTVMLSLGVALSVATVASTAEPADALTVPAAQYNMCTYDCINMAHDPVDIVLYSVTFSNPRPWLVTLNELCSPEYLDIKNSLEALGYEPVRVIEITGLDRGCGSWGNAAFILGQKSGYSSWTLSGSPARHLGCQKANTVAGQIAYCVGHSHQSSHPAEIRFIMNGTYPSIRKFFGGDLNKTPSTLQADAGWYDDYLDIDPQNRTTYKARSTGVLRKYDYVFQDGSATRNTPSPSCDYDASDHCYLHGQFIY